MCSRARSCLLPPSPPPPCSLSLCLCLSAPLSLCLSLPPSLYLSSLLSLSSLSPSASASVLLLVVGAGGALPLMLVGVLFYTSALIGLFVPPSSPTPLIYACPLLFLLFRLSFFHTGAQLLRCRSFLSRLLVSLCLCVFVSLRACLSPI